MMIPSCSELSIDYNKNVRDNVTVEAYNKLTAINRDGLTTITGWLLQFRQYFIDHYESEFDLRFAEFKQLCADKKIVVPDRMCELRAHTYHLCGN